MTLRVKPNWTVLGATFIRQNFGVMDLLMKESTTLNCRTAGV